MCLFQEKAISKKRSMHLSIYLFRFVKNSRLTYKTIKRITINNFKVIYKTFRLSKRVLPPMKPDIFIQKTLWKLILKMAILQITNNFSTKKVPKDLLRRRVQFPLMIFNLSLQTNHSKINIWPILIFFTMLKKLYLSYKVPETKIPQVNL